MKFSNSLKFNAVADWWGDYIAYAVLKKHIYKLEKKASEFETHSRYHDLESNEQTALISEPGASTTDTYFVPLLDRELNKITRFFEHQEKELLEEITDLEALVKAKSEESFPPRDPYGFEDDDEDDEDEDEDDEHRGSVSNERGGHSNRRRRSHKRPPGSLMSSELESPTLRRQRFNSISSSEDAMDLEASVSSLRQIPEDEPMSPTSGHERQSSRSGGRRKLADLFNRVLPTGSIASESADHEDLWHSRSNFAVDTRMLFKRRITNLYITATSLKSYVELNHSGFRKILKKYDKITDSTLKDRYLHDIVENAYPFQQSAKDHINDAINRLVNLYAKCVTRDDVSTAARQLRLHQREHIAWERDTVWRQMIGRERRGENVANPQGGVVVQEEETSGLVVSTPIGKLKFKTRYFSLLAAIIAFTVLLNTHSVAGVEANKCFSILIFSTILWATEAIPLFVTSIMVPLLLVCFQVFRDAESKEVLSTHKATTFVFQQMFSPTIMLLIGGFTIASALSKTNIDRVLITRVLSLAGTRPSTVLLAFMGVSCFASMWISNVAAPTLCFTLIKPILRTLPPHSAFAPCLIMGIALAANIGGQSSPISSPQNLIALEYMNPRLDWGSWFAVALPVSAISILLIWLMLLVSYRPSRTPDGDDSLQVRGVRPTKERFTLKQYWVTFVCLVTIVLWIVEKQIEDYVGDMGIIAIIPIIAFFSTGVLRKDDFEQFLWTIVFLAMGGIALGQGVTSSGLRDQLGELIRKLIFGLPEFTVVIMLSFIVLVVSTFISHTIAAVLLVPIAQEVGASLGSEQSRLIFLTALICSAGMGMPVSGFPNQTAATQEDDMGQLYLSNVDFLKNGVPASIIATLVVASVGYGLMLAIGI